MLPSPVVEIAHPIAPDGGPSQVQRRLFEACDELRDELRRLGVRVEDGAAAAAAAPAMPRGGGK